MRPGGRIAPMPVGRAEGQAEGAAGVSAFPALNDERAFAWLRARVPSAREIEVYFDPLSHERIVVLYGAMDEHASLLRSSLGLLAPVAGPSRVEVRP